MKRVRCPKCEQYITFDETQYTAGQSLVFKCPDCGKIHEIFGKSSVDSVAADFGIPVTVRLPIDPEMAALCDKGEAHKLKVQDIEDKFDALTEEILK